MDYRGDIREYFREPKVIRWTQEELVGVKNGQEYMTLKGIQTHCSQLISQNPKTVKSHLSLTLMRVKLVSMINANNV